MDTYYNPEDLDKKIYLNELTQIPDFESKIKDETYKQTLPSLDVMQVNLGRLCNLSCKHCHVEAGLGRTEVMSKEVMMACLLVYQEQGFTTIDITGGAPEMNPNFQWFVKESVKICDHVIVRSNLVVLLEEPYQQLLPFYAANKVELVCSLPCYREKDTDRQRGDGVFRKSIAVIQKLNELGYGKDPELVLTLIYNPGGAFFPPDQQSIEKLYKDELGAEYGIVFN